MVVAGVVRSMGSIDWCMSDYWSMGYEWMVNCEGRIRGGSMSDWSMVYSGSMVVHSWSWSNYWGMWIDWCVVGWKWCIVLKLYADYCFKENQDILSQYLTYQVRSIWHCFSKLFFPVLVSVLYHILEKCKQNKRKSYFFQFWNKSNILKGKSMRIHSGVVSYFLQTRTQTETRKLVLFWQNKQEWIRTCGKTKVQNKTVLQNHAKSKILYQLT